MSTSTAEAAPDYSIVVPAFNEERFLPATLAVLRAAMTEVPAAFRGEIVVCDNNSTDATAAIARAAGVRVVFEPVNQIARARNTGARAARGRYLIWVDADTEVSGRLLAATLAALASGGAAGGGSAMAMAAGGDPWFGRLLVFWNRVSRRLALAAGGYVFALREAFEAAGGFSESIYAGEELGFSRAVRSWGRERGLAFVILDGERPRTSSRKAEWYPAAVLLGSGLVLLAFPFLLRSRRFCWAWYRRPKP